MEKMILEYLDINEKISRKAEIIICLCTFKM